MSLVSRILGTRDVPTTLCINGGEDSLLNGPLGYDVATAIYLRAMHDKEFIDTMAPADYKSFVAGNAVEAMVTEKENDNVLRVMVQLGNGTCVRGDELTDADFRKTETVLTVGCVKKGKNYNFLLDNRNLQPVVHKYFLELCKEAWGLDKDDPNFVDKLLDLHWQYNPDEEKPQPKQPAQPQRPQQPASASAGVQTDANGVVTIGNFYTYKPLELKAALVQNKDNTLITDANDSIMGAMAKDLMQATGIYLGVYGKENSEPARQRKAAELIGFKEDQIDGLFGKKPKEGSDKGDSGKKDADGKDGSKTADEEFKTEPYRNRVGFGKSPKIDDGDPVPLCDIMGAIRAVKAVVLDENSSKAKVLKFATAWSALCDIVDKAIELNKTEVGMTYVHFQLGKANVYRLEVDCDGELIPLCFGEEE